MINQLSKNFSVTPNDLINDKELSRDSRFLFIYLSSKPSNWIYYAKTIEKELSCSKDSRIKYMKELIGSGWITVYQRIGENGKFGANDIQLNPCPNFSDTANKPDTENTVSDNFGGGKSTTLSNTNFKQISNKQTNTKDIQTDLFPEKKSNSTKKTLFCNSYYFDLEVFKSIF